jgi:pimeloyl-ACP methyl ester carboxylesterase
VGYRRWQGDGPPVVLLAGLGSTARLWGELPRLLTPRLTVLAPDNRGVGLSRGGAPFTLAGAADDVALVVRDAGCKRAGVLGVSMGGLIACHLAARHADAVSRLIVASCAPRLTPSHRRVLRFFELALTRFAPVEAAELLMAFAFGARFADAYPGFVDEAARLWAPDPDDVPGALAQVEHLAAGFDLRPLAVGIACPTIVLAGERDALVPAAATRELAAAIPGAGFRAVPEAGHSVLAEGGPGLLEDVVSFLTA